MAVRALENMWPDMLTEPEPSQTSPWGDFDPDHGPNAVKAWANGLLWPVPMDQLGPWEPMSRGEVAQVLDNVAMMVDFAGMPQPESGFCVAVLDGDTIRVRLDEGAEETVRLLGVDAPALSEPHGVQARDFLAYLVLAKPLQIYFDVQQRDEQGNLLAYVGTMDFGGLVNVEMLRMGLARLSDDALDLMDLPRTTTCSPPRRRRPRRAIWGYGRSWPRREGDRSRRASSRPRPALPGTSCSAQASRDFPRSRLRMSRGPSLSTEGSSPSGWGVSRR
jgi:endonuclease YncB( thermonuclease family)